MVKPPNYPSSLRIDYFLPPVLFDPLGPTHHVVDQRAEPVGQGDDEDPHDFVVAFRGLFRRAIDEHPDPEDRSQHADQEEGEETANRPPGGRRSVVHLVLHLSEKHKRHNRFLRA